MEQGDRWRALVNANPEPRESLRPGAEPWIGQQVIVEAWWIADDDERFAGEWVWGVVVGDNDPRPPFIWLPESELQFLECVREIER